MKITEKNASQIEKPDFPHENMEIVSGNQIQNIEYNCNRTHHGWVSGCKTTETVCIVEHTEQYSVQDLCAQPSGTKST